MGMSHAAYGAAGIGAGSSSVLEDQLLGTHGGRLQNSSACPDLYGGGYGGGSGGGYDDSPSVVVVLPMEDLAVTTAWTALTMLGVGSEQRRCRARAHGSPLRLISFIETHSMASVVLTAATQRCDWKWCRWGTRWSPFGYGRPLGRW